MAVYVQVACSRTQTAINNVDSLYWPSFHSVKSALVKGMRYSATTTTMYCSQITRVEHSLTLGYNIPTMTLGL